MLLEDILDIKPGTLIKGLVWSDQGNKCRFSLNRWDLDCLNLEEEIKEEGYTFPLLVYNGKTARLYLNQILTKTTKETLSFAHLVNNTRCCCESRWSGYNLVNSMETSFISTSGIVGLSLGISVAIFDNSIFNVHAKEAHEITCYHKILIGETIKWIKLSSDIRPYYDRGDSSALLSSPMWITPTP